MKGSTAKTILRSLKGKRLAGFLDFIGQETGGELLVEICRFLHKAPDVTEAIVVNQFNLARSQFPRLMDKIGQRLVSFLAEETGLVLVGQHFQLAKSMLARGKNDAAEDMIGTGIKEAMLVEDFDMALRFWKLAQPLPEPKLVGVVSPSRILGLRRNMLDFEVLWEQLEEAAALKVREKRLARIHEIWLSPILASYENAQGQRATYLLRRIRLNCLAHLKEYDLAIVEAQGLLDHVRSHPWVHEDAEYIEAKAMRILATILLRTKQIGLYEIASAELEQRKFGSSAATDEQYSFSYPYKTRIAIHIGNRNLLEVATTGFLKILEDGYGTRSPKYITQNLSVCLYGAFAGRQEELWVKLLRLLGRYNKVEFKPEYYCLYRFLLLAKAIETGDWPEARRHIKNLKNGTILDAFTGLVALVDFLSRQIAIWSRGTNLLAILDKRASAELAFISDTVDFEDFFDVVGWFESIKRGCTLLEIYKERASSSEEN